MPALREFIAANAALVSRKCDRPLVRGLLAAWRYRYRGLCQLHRPRSLLAPSFTLRSKGRCGHPWRPLPFWPLPLPRLPLAALSAPPPSPFTNP